MLGKLLLTPTPRTATRVLRDHLLVLRMRLFDRFGQARRRVGRIVGVAQVQPQLIGIVEIPLAPIAEGPLQKFGVR
jgi:hypothetical protein